MDKFIGSKIRKMRNHQKLGLNQLAEFAGLSNSALSNIERNKRHPKPETLKKIAKGLHVSPNKLLRLDGLQQENKSNNINIINNSGTINLNNAFAKHASFTYNNHKVDPNTVDYIKFMLQGKFGTTSRHNYN